MPESAAATSLCRLSRTFNFSSIASSQASSVKLKLNGLIGTHDCEQGSAFETKRKTRKKKTKKTTLVKQKNMIECINTASFGSSVQLLAYDAFYHISCPDAKLSCHVAATYIHICRGSQNNGYTHQGKKNLHKYFETKFILRS